jgi:hypothetical protein
MIPCFRCSMLNSSAFKKYKYETENKSISKFDLINRIVSLKSEFEFLLETPSQALQQSIVHPNLNLQYNHYYMPNP